MLRCPKIRSPSAQSLTRMLRCPDDSPQPNLNPINNTVIEDNMDCIDMDSETPCTYNNDSNIQDNISSCFAYTNEIRVETSLLKFLFDINAPNYAFKDIMNWAKDAHCTGYKF